MRTSTAAPIGILLALIASSVLAQSNLGQLLDEGAIKLTAQDFHRQIVGKVLEGPVRGTVRGLTSSQEIVYLEGGLIRGSGQASIHGGATGGGNTFSIEGTWAIDDQQRVCQSTRAGSVVLAPRCQFWFKQSDKYFIADSDTDRSAQLTLRSLMRR
jgi:hypothetical protein